jgi:hypothetical protein
LQPRFIATQSLLSRFSLHFSTIVRRKAALEKGPASQSFYQTTNKNKVKQKWAFKKQEETVSFSQPSSTSYLVLLCWFMCRDGGRESKSKILTFRSLPWCWMGHGILVLGLFFGRKILQRILLPSIYLSWLLPSRTWLLSLPFCSVKLPLRLPPPPPTLPSPSPPPQSYQQRERHVH